ncbi:hypothetical protein [Clostridium brassicae]|uniref:ABC transporter permease n=1 Tax=Clostridium brassicae TaxID=2999072 RepID=A0ABT4D7W5_9CLOT|nr:hypothetical protein [Clostridium brassicae]MCY6958382.1 hypothetical protein [Clostridium brassicae]
MRIFINELKKIFNLKNILVLLLINVALYFLFVEFDIEYFPNGRPENDAYRIGVSIINEKGNNLKDEDTNYLCKMKENMRKKANDYLKNNEKAKKLNIKDYVNFEEERSKAQGARSKDLENFHDDIFFKDGVNVFWELQTIDYYINNFKYKEERLKVLQTEEDHFKFSQTKKAYKDRLNEIRKNKSQNSILPWFVFENYNNLIRYSSIAIIISIIFMIAPIFTRDARNSLELLQYTTRKGRNLYKDKIKTAIIASLIIMTIQLGVLSFLYTTRTYSVNMFYNSNINSCFTGYLFWVNITFIQYIILTGVLLYIVGIIVTLITCYVSRKISNYMPLIGTLIPVSVFLIYITKSVIVNIVGIIGVFKYKVPIIIAVLTLISTTSVVTRYRKEKKIDIVL